MLEDDLEERKQTLETSPADPGKTTASVDAHDHGHSNDHDHSHPSNPLIDWFQHLIHPHAHSYQMAALDAALATERGLWAVKVSFIALMSTAVFQMVIVWTTGSVALLADTIHNFSDALTAIPLGLAFILARRSRNTRFTYGYGRAEDIAGVIIILMITFSAVDAIYEAVKKIISPQPIDNLGWLAVAAVVGFLGNELVALFRIRVGREIGSAALVADGLHARTDGLTSLAVLVGAIGVWLGFPLADPIIGLVIGVSILGIAWRSAREIWYRVMDAVDPAIYAQIEGIAARTPGVIDVHDLAVRWVGHRLRTELHITVNCQLPTYQSHIIAEDVRHEIFHELPAMVDISVHTDPCECDELIDYHPSAHHSNSRVQQIPVENASPRRSVIERIRNRFRRKPLFNSGQD